MNIENIQRKATTEEFDYCFLMDCLSMYSNPRDKISRLIKSGAIIRVKKGLYVFGPDYSKGVYSREILANLIFGPSYISLEYALYYYGLIPERIETVTSVTNKRNKFFKTSVGCFSYEHIAKEKYAIGVVIQNIDERRGFLIASKEKALSDKIYRLNEILNIGDLMDYLKKYLRLDVSALNNFKRGLLKELARVYESRSVELLYDLTKKEKI